MTGINRSNINMAAVLALSLIGGMLPQRVTADDLMLEGAERLSGKVMAIHPDGTVLLDTPLAPEAVALKGESVRKVLFTVPEGKAAAAACQVTLQNGDVLAATVGSIDEKNASTHCSPNH